MVSPRELDERAVEALQRLGPFGQGNPEPVLVLRRQVARPRVLPPKSGRRRGPPQAGAAWTPRSWTPSASAWRTALSLVEGPVDLAFQAGFDTFRGQRSCPCELKDLRAAA